jgi:hypothetical protein
MGKNRYDWKRSDAYRADPREVVIVGRDVPVDGHRLYPGFDDRRATDEPQESMVRSILAEGVIHPVVLMKIGGRGHVLVGRGRTIAARAAREINEMITLPVVESTLNEKRATVLDVMRARIAENAIRRDYDPDALGREIAGLIRIGATPAEVETTVGRSWAWCQRLSRFPTLAEPVRDAVAAGQLSASAALEVVDLPEAEQVGAVADVAKSGAKATVQTVRARVRTDRWRPPSLPRLKRLVESDGLSDDHKAIIRWARGLAPDDAVRHIPGLIDEDSR